MALIDCPGCGNKVSDRAKACPKCGMNLSLNPFIKENIVIPKECKADILRELNDYGINRAFVYPELENQIKEICKNF